jgi:hypothetical protein
VTPGLRGRPTAAFEPLLPLDHFRRENARLPERNFLLRGDTPPARSDLKFRRKIMREHSALAGFLHREFPHHRLPAIVPQYRA